MSRLEQIEGERWARSTCEEIGALRVRGNNAMNVIEVLQRGLVEKPADYRYPHARGNFEGVKKAP